MPLTEFAQQIEHFGRNILLHHPLVGGAQCMTHLAGGGALLAGSGCFAVGIAHGIGLAPAPAFPVIRKVQVLIPLTARSAAPAAYDLVRESSFGVAVPLEQTPIFGGPE